MTLPSKFSSYEKLNARQWDEESTVSDVTTLTTANVLLPRALNVPSYDLEKASAYNYVNPESSTSTRAPLAARGPPPGLTKPPPHLAITPANSQHLSRPSGTLAQAQAQAQRPVPSTAPPRRNGHQSSSSSDSNIYINPARSALQGVVGNSSPVRRPDGRPIRGPLPPRAKWADAAGLVTTRRSIQNAEDKEKAAEESKYLKLAPGGDDFTAVGYYIWQNRDIKPTHLLGWQLDEVDWIKIKYKVHIDWHDNVKFLKVSSRVAGHSDTCIKNAIKEIRNAIDAARARVKMANPVHIIVPPTASAMRKTVMPADFTRGSTRMARQFEMIGEELTSEEKLERKVQRLSDIEVNLAKLEHLLKADLMELAAYKGSMRMRVHLGHITLIQFHNDLVDGKQDLKAFEKMMGSTRLHSEFDKKIGDGKTVMALRDRIVNWPERFCPASARVDTLQEIKFRNTEILMVREVKSKRGDDKKGDYNIQKYRIEMDIDSLREKKPGEYQLGTTRFFLDNETAKRVEITTVDIEKGLDWQLVINSDKSITPIPDHITQLISKSINTKTTSRTDSLGLTYPDMRPIPTHEDLEITQTILRSVIQYMLIESGYIVEIAIYREWDNFNTKGIEPRMSASVALFCKDWDVEMGDREGMPGVREWSQDMREFFQPVGGEGGPEKGFRDFLSEIETLQGYLLDADAKMTAPRR